MSEGKMQQTRSLSLDASRLLHYFGLIPDLRNEGYSADGCFLNCYGETNPIRVGCKYSGISIKDGKEVSQQLLIVTEVFDKEPKIEEFETERIENNEIYYGYVPKFQIAQDFMQTREETASTSLSWKEDNKVTTLMSLRRREAITSDSEELPTLPSYDDSARDTQLKDFFRMVVRTKTTLDLEYILSLVAYLPSAVREWRLVTTILSSKIIRMGNEVHLIPNVEGDYQQGTRFIKLSFAYAPLFEPDELKENLTPSVGRTIVINGISVHLKEDDFATLVFYSKQEDYAISVSNNQTTREFTKYEDAMKELMLEAIRAFKGFSNIQQTEKLLNALRG